MCDWEITYLDSEKWWSEPIAPQGSLLGQSPGDSSLQQHVSEQPLNLGLLLLLPLDGLGQPSGVGESLLLRGVGSNTAHLVAMQQSTQQYLFFPTSAPLWAAIGKLLNIWSCKGEAAAQSSKFPEELPSGLQQGCRWRVEALFPSLVNKMTQTFQFRNCRTLSGNTFLMYDKTSSSSTQSLLNIATFRSWRTTNTTVSSCWNRNVWICKDRTCLFCNVSMKHCGFGNRKTTNIEETITFWSQQHREGLIMGNGMYQHNQWSVFYTLMTVVQVKLFSCMWHLVLLILCGSNDLCRVSCPDVR